ncbi:hydroxymethylglutaryl-CoA lyase [Acidisphaera rubrifaciens]|uniref:Pyruvate carboxyltransferase n=1 Tax=Acidisphaera rubrifaciens HS-AP3 TaxID=1231350 RepID=A0A0D6P3N6_9PROT|nr:hydroxymethylglutaryl-CoA lyase [Acidisphaera rubrifaciens]GAN75803.1 pyruvate carboxyltransferase [Acidisphaera rubrifaciens HS-AP3]
MGEAVTVREVGPRDGLQMAATRMATADKQRWIAAIAAAGLPEIEVGSFVPPRVIPQMADTDAVLRASVGLGGPHGGPVLVALVPNLRGAQAALAAGAGKITIPVSVSEGHSRANINKTPDEQIAEVARIAEWMRGQDRPVPVEAACSTAFGCSIDGVVPLDAVLRVAEGLAAAGADTIALADTVGYANPAQIRRTVRAVRAAIGARLERLHLHDTMGLGIANALAGLDEGIRAFDSCIGGLGGCPYAPGASGNIVTEDLVFMLESMGHATGIDFDRLLEARAILHAALPDEPIHGQMPKAGLPRTFRRAA